MATIDATKMKTTFNLKKILGTTDHKTIGILYFLYSFFNFAIAGLFALTMRLELMNPGGQGFVQPADWGTFFTTHGVAMIFIVIFPLNSAFGNYMIPLLVGAKDLYWPRWNNIAFWMLIPGALFIWLGLPRTGWTGYAPLTLRTPGGSVDMWAIGLLILGVSAVIGAINFIATIIFMRKPGLSWGKLDLFSWSMLITSMIQIFATPIITTGLVMLLLDRLAGATFFDFSHVTGPILWQHVFWSYSHPAVYIMVLPAMGLTSVLISKFSKNPIFGYKSMVVSMFAISIIGFTVWGHHLFTTGLIPNVMLGFTIMTYIIAVPSGIKVFNWISTLYGGEIELAVPMLFGLGFVFGFMLGGFTGMFVNIVPLDFVLHDTYYVLSHFHFVVIGGSLSAFFGSIYYLLPHITKKMYHKKIALSHFLFWTVGFVLTFGSFAVLGSLGMPRRYFDYSTLANVPLLSLFHTIATIGAIFMGFAFFLLIVNVVWTVFKGPDAGTDPFNLGEKFSLIPPLKSTD